MFQRAETSPLCELNFASWHPTDECQTQNAVQTSPIGIQTSPFTTRPWHETEQLGASFTDTKRLWPCSLAQDHIIRCCTCLVASYWPVDALSQGSFFIRPGIVLFVLRR